MVHTFNLSVNLSTKCLQYLLIILLDAVMVLACSLQEIKLFINASLPAHVLHILLQMRLSNALAVIVYSHIRLPNLLCIVYILMHENVCKTALILHRLR